MQRRLLELISEQAETGNVRCPAEAGRLELMDRDLEGVARSRSLDEDRTGNRIDLGEVEGSDVASVRFSVESVHRKRRRISNSMVVPGAMVKTGGIA